MQVQRSMSDYPVLIGVLAAQGNFQDHKVALLECVRHLGSTGSLASPTKFRVVEVRSAGDLFRSAHNHAESFFPDGNPLQEPGKSRARDARITGDATITGMAHYATAKANDSSEAICTKNGESVRMPSVPMQRKEDVSPDSVTLWTPGKAEADPSTWGRSSKNCPSGVSGPTSTKKSRLPAVPNNESRDLTEIGVATHRKASDVPEEEINSRNPLLAASHTMEGACSHGTNAEQLKNPSSIATKIQFFEQKIQNSTPRQRKSNGRNVDLQSTMFAVDPLDAVGTEVERDGKRRRIMDERNLIISPQVSQNSLARSGQSTAGGAAVVDDCTRKQIPSKSSVKANPQHVSDVSTSELEEVARENIINSKKGTENILASWKLPTESTNDTQSIRRLLSFLRMYFLGDEFDERALRRRRLLAKQGLLEAQDSAESASKSGSARAPAWENENHLSLCYPKESHLDWQALHERRRELISDLGSKLYSDRLVSVRANCEDPTLPPDTKPLKMRTLFEPQYREQLNTFLGEYIGRQTEAVVELLRQPDAGTQSGIIRSDSFYLYSRIIRTQIDV